MDEFFNTREIAIIVWSLIAFVATLFSKSMRKSYSGLINTFFSTQIIVVYALMLMYIGAVIMFLMYINFWNNSLLKDTIKWVLFAASVTLFQINKNSKNRNFYTQTVKQIFKLTLIVEFLTDLYTFSLINELLLVPTIVLTGGIMAFSEKKEEHKQVYSLIRKASIAFGTLIFSRTIYMTFSHYDILLTTSTLQSFLLSPILTLSLLPFIYLLSIYMAFEVNFTTMKYTSLDKDFVNYAKRQAIRHWLFDKEGLERWQRQLRIITPETKKAIVESIYEVKKRQKKERNPPVVSIDDGWSPHAANKFLNPPLQTGFYEPAFFDDTWNAFSHLFYVGDKWLSNTVDYQISGSSTTAYSLVLKLTVFTPEYEQSLCLYYIELVTQLFNAALNTSVPPNLLTAVIEGKKFKSTFQGHRVSFKKNYWGNSYNSYNLILCIEHKAKPHSCF
ncbi:hypothetical protein [Rubrolithibacter danxiaensis]|uniref:hypothetical protein n=1 Tax=Rubrolithibacter danxiaensis TaxID=3390805 RepID=UPI003BF877DC